MKEITIKTKYDLGQEVVFYSRQANKLSTFTIDKISFSLTKDGTKVYYFSDNLEICKAEEECFASREEFIAQL